MLITRDGGKGRGKTISVSVKAKKKKKRGGRRDVGKRRAPFVYNVDKKGKKGDVEKKERNYIW